LDEINTPARGTTPPLVALVEWHTPGHHLTWYRGFCRALLELGCQVAAFCPFPNEVKEYLTGCLPPEALSRIRFVEFNLPKPPRIRPLRWRPAVQAWQFGKRFGRALAEGEATFGRPFDLVFYSALYGWEHNYVRRLIAARPRPWVGLNMHARVPGTATRISLVDLLRDPNARAVAMVDEGFTSVVEQALGKPAVIFPDITDESWQADHPLEQRFRRLSGTDKLVVSIGHMRPDKGVGTLAQVALNPGASGLAFGFVGEVDWWMDAKSRAFLEQALTQAPRAMFHFNKVPEGLPYNAILRACDVMFAAYRDFPHSSNSLTKAAVFEKPIIVSEGHLMAKRVLEYRMGEVVPQDDPVATLAAIRRITDNYPAWLAEKNPRWQEYRAVHSHEALVRAFSKLLS
jgi:glycosyltransferase involved in cell wall biosynthesis